MGIGKVYKMAIDEYIAYLKEYRASLDDLPDDSSHWWAIAYAGVKAFRGAEVVPPPEPPPLFVDPPARGHKYER